MYQNVHDRTLYCPEDEHGLVFKSNGEEIANGN